RFEPPEISTGGRILHSKFKGRSSKLSLLPSSGDLGPPAEMSVHRREARKRAQDVSRAERQPVPHAEYATMGCHERTRRPPEVTELLLFEHQKAFQPADMKIECLRGLWPEVLAAD